MPNFTAFDQTKRYIFTRIAVVDVDGGMQDFLAILDTGAPMTEFSDEALQQLGFLEKTKTDIALQSGLPTQKYDKIILPHIEICSRVMEYLEVYVSHFDKSWGIDALVGLDFFKRFRTTIDYRAGQSLQNPTRTYLTPLRTPC